MSWTDIPDFVPGQVLDAVSMNRLRDNAAIGHQVCTSATRPSSPDTGTMIYESDTGDTLIWNGSAWTYPNDDLWRSPSSAPASPQTGDIYWSITTYGAEGWRWSGSQWQRISDSRRVLVSATTNFSQNTGIVTWNQISVNTGVLYNSANGAFTAPYLGYYQVTAMGMTQNAAGYGLYDIYKNGGRYYPYYRGYAYNSAAGHSHFTVNGMVYCAVNDYIQIRYEGTIQRYGDGNGYGAMNIEFVGS